MSQNITTIATILSSYYSSNTQSIVRIDNKYLSAGDYSFTLKLTNFLGESSIAKTTISVSSNSYKPSVTIAGTSPLTYYRWQTLSLYAVASLPSCDSFTDNYDLYLSYSWRVYIGTTYYGSYKSTSLDSRFFKLAAYTLDTGVSYTVEVEAGTMVGSRNTSLASSSSSITVMVGTSGVSASIAGQLIF